MLLLSLIGNQENHTIILELQRFCCDIIEILVEFLASGNKTNHGNTAQYFLCISENRQQQNHYWFTRRSFSLCFSRKTEATKPCMVLFLSINTQKNGNIFSAALILIA